jgi:phage-related holin
VFIKAIQLPDVNLLVWIGFAMIIDFITGVVKAKVKKEVRSSEGFRKTITKFLQYGVAIIVSVILSNTAKYNVSQRVGSSLELLCDALMVFILYIEVTSIFENIYQCDKKSVMSKYFIKPVLNFLTFQIRNNPATKLTDTTKDTEQ